MTKWQCHYALLVDFPTLKSSKKIIGKVQSVEKEVMDFHIKSPFCQLQQSLQCQVHEYYRFRLNDKYTNAPWNKGRKQFCDYSLAIVIEHLFSCRFNKREKSEDTTGLQFRQSWARLPYRGHRMKIMGAVAALILSTVQWKWNVKKYTLEIKMFKWQRRKYKNEAIVGGGKAVKRQIFYNFSIEEDL